MFCVPGQKIRNISYFLILSNYFSCVLSINNLFMTYRMLSLLFVALTLSRLHFMLMLMLIVVNKETYLMVKICMSRVTQWVSRQIISNKNHSKKDGQWYRLHFTFSLLIYYIKIQKPKSIYIYYNRYYHIFKYIIQYHSFHLPIRSSILLLF